MVVLKFGGSSVATIEMIDAILDIVQQRLDEAPVLVSSAMGKTTDRLVEATDAAGHGDREGYQRVYNELRSAHEDTVGQIADTAIRERATRRLSDLFDEVQALLTGVYLIQECSPRTRDAVLSFGERLATEIVHARACERGIDSILLDSRDLIRTDDEFNAANVEFTETTTRIRAYVTPTSGRVIVLQGFIARTADGVTSTLGRGGSDYSASIIAAALDAQKLEIWTDVDGIMTMDPQIVPEARTVDSMSYDEAAELAFFGARVVHPSTIQPAVDRGIPVYVRNTRNPDRTGTRISGTGDEEGPRALASKSPTTVITIHSSRMLNAYGFLARIFAIFERHRLSVDVVATSEVSVSVTLDDPPDLSGLMSDLAEFGRVEREDDQALICIVGNRLWRRSETVARVFDSLRDIPIRLISLGSSDVNLTLIVPSDSLQRAVRTLHNTLFVP